MAKRMTPQQVFTDLLDRYGPEITRAFLDAVNDLRSAVEIQRVIDALARGDINAALEALHLDEAAMEPLETKIREAYIEGGKLGADSLPSRNPDGQALIVRFNVRNPRAEQWLRDHSSALVTQIITEQREAVRTALAAGMERGVNPRTTALDIVGRIDKATGKREGGILGLSAPQEAYVATARSELASSDPQALKHYLTRARRDKRFDPAINRAIRDEKAIPAETVRKALVAYERRLLQLRGEMIGRTEALTSLHAAQYEAIMQAVDSGQITSDQVRRVWKSASDFRVRDTHRGLNGDTVGLTQAFTSPSGARMRFPGDTSLGAPASEIINCRCMVSIRVDWLANLR